jgi:hypothetical protein
MGAMAHPQGGLYKIAASIVHSPQEKQDKMEGQAVRNCWW